MKKLLLFSVVAISGFTTMAQTKKGDKLVGVSFGEISYTHTKNETSYSNTPTVYKSDGNSFYIAVTPNVAWFVQDNLAIGGGITFSLSHSKSNSSNTGSPATSDYTSTNPSFYLSPMARYYFGGSEKGMPFAQVNVGYGIYAGKNKSTTSGGASSETTYKPKGDWNAGLSFGYEHFVTQSVGIFGSIGFNYEKSKTTYEYRPSTGTGYDYTSSYTRFYIPVNAGIQVHCLGGGKTRKK